MIIKNLPQFTTDKELFDFLVSNEETIFAQAKSQIKEADAFSHLSMPLRDALDANKTAAEQSIDLLSKDVLDVKAVINTTNILDSHKDVHIPGLWDKSLKEASSRMLHVQEHKSREFDKIISSGEDLKAYTETVSFKSLGYNFKGTTEALTFDSQVRKNRNEYMHEQYAKGFVTNHSVGMIYVKMVTCINCEDYGAQYEAYQKYSKQIVNQKALENTKYFWAILEAKAVEGSAVPNGSNWVTPTTSVKGIKEEIKEVSKEQLAIMKFLNIN